MSDEIEKITVSEQQAAMDQLKAVFEDKVATINGRDYAFSMTSHPQRVKVFAFFTKIRPQLERHDFSFLDTKEWAEVEKVINNIVMYDGSLLSRRQLHWEEFPEDYMMFVSTALGVISYPFLRGKRTA